jgi:hypothetical protein
MHFCVAYWMYCTLFKHCRLAMQVLKSDSLERNFFLVMKWKIILVNQGFKTRQISRKCRSIIVLKVIESYIIDVIMAAQNVMNERKKQKGK